MSTNTAQAQTSPDGLFPIRTVSELTGINAITLRAWERRYGLLEPVRKASGHRLYTQEHIDLINRVVGLLDRGMRIGQVRAHLELKHSRSDSPAEGDGDVWTRYLNRMIASVIRFDELGLEATYGEALSIYPVETVTGKLLTPLLHELGRRWESNEGSVAEEHFFGFYIRNKFGARFHHRQKTSDGPKLLLACLPGDRHETGLLLFALAANDAGFVPIMLGADMPLRDLPAAAGKIDCAAIVLSGLIQPDTSVMKQDLPALVKATSVPVFIGGQVSVKEFDAIKRMGAEPMGTDVGKALSSLSGSLGLREEVHS
jgi:DNA-binding transcriptional MerR regulator/methylmalonyl-CoA mutase cobalamin-binding subunit